MKNFTRDDIEFRHDYDVMEATEAICLAMSREKVSRAELARRMGVTRGWVTQILKGDGMTIKTLSNVLHALGYQPLIRLRREKQAHEAARGEE